MPEITSFIVVSFTQALAVLPVRVAHSLENASNLALSNTL